MANAREVATVIGAVLLIVWLGGLLSSRTAGGLLHLLPLVASGVVVAGFVVAHRKQEVERPASGGSR